MKQKAIKALLTVLGAGMFAPVSSWAQQYGGRNDYWGPHMMWGRGWMGGGFMIIFWILVIVAIFLGIRWATRRGDSSPGHFKTDNALEVLKRRYASGEIDRDQFISMKKDLEN